MVKIKITRADLRKWRYVDLAAAMKISEVTELPAYVSPSHNIIEIDDPVTQEPAIVKIYGPRSLGRAINRGQRRGITTVKPFSFFIPNMEVPNHYEYTS